MCRLTSKSGAARFNRRSRNQIRSSMKIKTTVLIAMLLVSGQSEAWIAYGFKSGMSRFDVIKSLSDKESFVITEDAQQTHAGPDGNRTKYNLVYCSTPQKLYLMKFRLADSLAVFMQAREKYEKRYGKPEGLDYVSGNLESENWEDADISLIWDINEFETVLLTHGKNGTSAEFQDVSVCQ